MDKEMYANNIHDMFGSVNSGNI